jgi:hypothetical protein
VVVIVKRKKKAKWLSIKTSFQQNDNVWCLSSQMQSKLSCLGPIISCSQILLNHLVFQSFDLPFLKFSWLDQLSLFVEYLWYLLIIYKYRFDKQPEQQIIPLGIRYSDSSAIAPGLISSNSRAIRNLGLSYRKCC